MAGVNNRAIYKNTTIDPPGTIAHCKAKGVEIFKPRENFFAIVERKGLPSRFQRFCCEILKEYKTGISEQVIMGIRREESVKRAARYKEPTECRFYGSKKEHIEAIYPILEWTKEDVAEFIKERGIECHKLYYDESGNFHPERRLGCMICPLQSQKKLREVYKQYPIFLALTCKSFQKYWDNSGDIKKKTYFSSPYDVIMYTLFHNNIEEFNLWKHGMFGDNDSREFLSEYFGVDL